MNPAQDTLTHELCSLHEPCTRYTDTLVVQFQLDTLAMQPPLPDREVSMSNDALFQCMATGSEYQLTHNISVLGENAVIMQFQGVIFFSLYFKRVNHYMIHQLCSPT